MKRLAVVAGAVLALGLAACGSKDGSVADPRSFVPNCVAGLSQMGESEPSWQGAKASIVDPDVIERTSPQLVACAAEKANGQVAAYRIRVQCVGSIERHCTSLAGAISEARIDGARRAETGDYNSFTFASHCLNALSLAGERGLVSKSGSALDFPWNISGEREADGATKLRCAVEVGSQPATVIARTVCDDPDQERCTELVAVEGL
jgi:hypothetical protein